MANGREGEIIKGRRVAGRSGRKKKTEENRGTLRRLEHKLYKEAVNICEDRRMERVRGSAGEVLHP